MFNVRYLQYYCMMLWWDCKWKYILYKKQNQLFFSRGKFKDLNPFPFT